MSTINKGQAAPNFELSAMNSKLHSLQEALTHGPILITFFKVNCPTCQYTFPFIERLYQQFRMNGIQIWAVSQDNAPANQAFVQEFGITFPILIDDYPYEASRTYGVKFVPTIFLIKSDGKVELMSDGFARGDLLAIQKWFAKHFSSDAAPLFLPSERVPEFKPG